MHHFTTLDVVMDSIACQTVCEQPNNSMVIVTHILGMLADPIELLHTIVDKINMDIGLNFVVLLWREWLGKCLMTVNLNYKQFLQVTNTIGDSTLRPKQLEVLLKFIGGWDIFVAWLTGSGKSAIQFFWEFLIPYILNSMVRPVAIVLITLMSEHWWKRI